MSDSKNRPSKACEAAWSYLKSAQSKIKLHHNENAQGRNFKPGDKVQLHYDEDAHGRNFKRTDKVFAHLLISGKPLQARY